jgi:exodeoxyribonuclease VII small subunit
MCSAKKKEDLHFEKGLERLEEILEKMNSGTVGLDDSLKLYEEADSLIKACGAKLNDAERKIEMLIKGRDGAVIVDNDGTPTTEPFSGS